MWMAILAMAFYALEIAITDLKLGTISPRLMTLYYSSGVAIFALVSLLISREQITVPSGTTTWFVILMILSSFVAATAHFIAIHEGLGTARMSLAYAFLPVAGALYISFFKRELPSWNLILACVLAGIALYLVSSSEEPASL